jgi:hypothetical protein
LVLTIRNDRGECTGDKIAGGTGLDADMLAAEGLSGAL